MRFSELERFFYRNPDRSIHLRELSRELDVSTGYISGKIDQLIEQGIVNEKKKGNMRSFSAVTSNRRYRLSKKSFNINQILSSDLIRYIDENLYPDTTVLFGSYLEGTDNQESDIDLAVINARKKSLDLNSYETEFEREINITNIEKLEDCGKSFKNTLANGLVLSGYLKVS